MADHLASTHIRLIVDGRYLLMRTFSTRHWFGHNGIFSFVPSLSGWCFYALPPVTPEQTSLSPVYGVG